MHIPLDIKNDVPLYQQIKEYIRDSIISGHLEQGTRLPATRKLAHDLGVNRITVENAYTCLEADGLIYSHVGKGTFVLPLCPLSEIHHEGDNIKWPSWQQETADKHSQLDSLTHFRKLIEINRPHMITFSNGTGDNAHFPVDEFRKIINMVLRRDGIEAMEYGEYNGYYPLRNTIAHILASQGLNAHPDNLLITSGSQQAITLVSQYLLKAGDTVVVESPTYAGALDQFYANGYHIIGIPCDDHGMQVERLDHILPDHTVKLIYTIPNFQNPTGTCMSSQRRRRLVSLAAEYNIPILEDDFVGDLRYDGRSQPSLKALDPGGNVIYISTFSKMLVPGLRIGFLMAEGPIMEQLTSFKKAIDISSPNLIQRALEAYLTVGRYQAHYRRSCQLYRKRRDTMMWAIEHYLPADVMISSPKGGLFLWVRLPPSLSTDDLLELAIEEGVTFSPGKRFYPKDQEKDNYLRLNFAMNTPKEIEEGIKRLAKAIKKFSLQSQYASSVSLPVSK